jgi:hypothetical protein
MLADLLKRAAEAAIGAIVVVVAATLSEELARMLRDADRGQGSEPKSKG